MPQHVGIDRLDSRYFDIEGIGGGLDAEENAADGQFAGFDDVSDRVDGGVKGASEGGGEGVDERPASAAVPVFVGVLGRIPRNARQERGSGHMVSQQQPRRFQPLLCDVRFQLPAVVKEARGDSRTTAFPSFSIRNTSSSIGSFVR